MKVFLVAIALTISGFAQTPTLSAVHKVFIDKMDNNLDQ